VIEIKAVIIAVGAALVIGAGAGGYAAWQYRAMKADNDLLDLRNTFDSATAAAKEQSLGVERELQAQINQVSQKGRDENQKIESNAAVAASTTGSLLAAADQRFSATACDPGVARRGAAATSAAYLYSQLLGESQRLAEGLAKEADSARSRGQSCEAAYDTVRRGLDLLRKGAAVTAG
jgi:hypothetical protein